MCLRCHRHNFSYKISSVVSIWPPVHLFIFGFAGSWCPVDFPLVLGMGVPLSSCDAQASHCGGFSFCGARALGHVGFGSCSTWASVVVAPGL